MQRWELRIRPGNIRLAHRFLNFNPNTLLDVGLNFGESWIFCFHQISTGEPIRREQEIVRNRKQGTVLVDIVKFVDSPERIVSAFVRLEPVDSFFGFRPHSIYFSSLNGFVLGRTLGDRKSNVPANRARSEVRRAHKDKAVARCDPGRIGDCG